MYVHFKHRPAWAQFFTFLGLAIGIFFVLSAIAVFILSSMTGIPLAEMSANLDYNHPGMLFFLRGMILVQFIGLFSIPVFTYARMADPKPLDYLGLSNSTKPVFFVVGILAMFISLPLVEGLGILNQQAKFPDSIESWMKRSEAQGTEQIKFFLSHRSPRNLILNLIMIAGFAGIGEELFFRGVLQRIFIQWFRSPWAGIIAAAFVFSAIHMQFYGFLPRFLLGLILGALYWYSGSLWVAILAHFAYDAFFVVAVYLNPQMAEDETATLFNTSGTIIGAVVSAAILVLLFRWLKKNAVTDYSEWRKRENQVQNNPFNF